MTELWIYVARAVRGPSFVSNLVFFLWDPGQTHYAALSQHQINRTNNKADNIKNTSGANKRSADHRANKIQPIIREIKLWSREQGQQ